jgi:undecaprenyl phosphate N,N'-diacetylbacillosamine 1-phosphate transferase
MRARRNDHDGPKRIVELMIIPVVIVALLPLYGFVALLVFLQLGSPVLYRGERAGKNEKLFKQYKFRTMIENTHDAEGRILGDEERLTRFGRLLRKTSLDELPQLFNVLFGHMSLIGPRPLPSKYLALYNSFESQRHLVRPGLTGLAQASGRNLVSWSDRFELDVAYVQGATFGVDARIILRTLKLVVAGHGVSATGHATGPEFFGSLPAVVTPLGLVETDDAHLAVAPVSQSGFGEIRNDMVA